MIDEEKIFQQNIKNWNERVHIHKLSKKIYNIEAFKKGNLSFVANEHKELIEHIDSFEGKDLIHLMCHFGLDTLSFAKLGANVTGVDFSEEAIKLAEKIAKETKIDAKFVKQNIYGISNLIKQKFDIVFTSCGVLSWLPDLNKWAREITNLLKENGIFYIKESHPISYIFDYDAESPDKLIPRYPYFNDNKMLIEDIEYTYAHDGTSKVLEETISYQFNHRLSEIINPLIQAGLTIKYIDESPLGFYQQFNFMNFDKENKLWKFPDKHQTFIPLTFTIIATLEKNS
jgi:SAM-dependent methyltransferase